MSTSGFGHSEMRSVSTGECWSMGTAETYAEASWVPNPTDTPEAFHDREGGRLLDDITDLDDVAGDLFVSALSVMPPMSLAGLPPGDFLNMLAQDFGLALLARDDTFTQADEEAFISRIIACFAAHRGRQLG